MSDPNEFESILNDLEEEYSKTPASSQDVISDGVYQLRIEEASLRLLERPDGKVLTSPWKYTVLDEGEFKGKTITTWDRLNNRNSMSFFKEKLLRCGLNPETSLRDLEPEMATLPCTIVEAQVKNNRGTQGRVFTNVYIRNVVGKDESLPI